MCGSKKDPYPPHRRSLEIPRGSGVLKAKFLEAMYENKLKFPRGEGCKAKKPSWGGGGGVWIFSAIAQYFQRLKTEVFEILFRVEKFKNRLVWMVKMELF